MATVEAPENPHPDIDEYVQDGEPWWYKCAAPERPGDRNAVYVWDCDACYLGLMADAQREPQALSHERAAHDTTDVTTLADTLSHAAAWRAGEGLPLFEQDAGRKVNRRE